MKYLIILLIWLVLFALMAAIWLFMFPLLGVWKMIWPAVSIAHGVALGYLLAETVKAINNILRRRAGDRFAAHSRVRLRRAFTAARIDIPAGTEGVIVDIYPFRDAYEVEVSLATALTVTVFGSDLDPIDA